MALTDIEIAEKFANHENRLKVSEHRIEDLEKQQKDIQTLTVSVHELAISVKNLTEEQKAHTSRIAALEMEPATKWKELVKAIIVALVGVVIGYLMKGGI